MSFKFYSGVYSCLLLTVFISLFPVSAEVPSDKELASRVTGKKVETPSTSTGSAAKDRNGNLRLQLWQARTSVYQGEKDSKSKGELKQLIKKIRSIVFKPQEQAPKPLMVVEPRTKEDPNEIPSSIKMQEEPNVAKTLPETKNKIKPGLQYQPVSDQTLETLQKLTQEPNQLDRPFELAEVLFLSGQLKQASAFYKQALNRMNADVSQAGPAKDRAWVLFQIGNCLRNDDLPAAKKAYRQLIAEYPHSPWAELAKAQEKLIDWYLKDKPQTLIAECKKLANAP